MKTICFFLMMTFVVITAKAQYSDDNNGAGNIRAGVAYVHDFPGLTGTAAYAGYSFPLNEWLQGGVGVKHVQTSGYPRTNTVQEYTKANTVDFELLFVPVHTENMALRVGLNYTFSFYNIRRAYPVYTTNGDKQTISSWPVADSKGRVHGTGLVGEYEYYFGSTISAGVKVEVTKAYDGIIMGGPFMAIRL